MNWAKGLFRIWVIISALWVVPFFLMHEPIANIERVNRHKAELDDLDGLWPVERLQNALERAEAAGDGQGAAQLQSMINESWNGVYRTHERRDYDSAKRSLEEGLQIILIPPAVLGFILFGIWWIASGFAARKRD